MKPTPALAPHRVAIFTPGRQTDDEVKAAFIARTATLDALLDDITSTRAGGIPQHHLLIGQRGMGKTTLLRRIAVSLREEPLDERFLPLGFPEEQWTVDRLSTVWLNCLDSLADTLEHEDEQSVLVDEIDTAVERLRHDALAEQLLAEEVERAFLQFAARTGRTPVLLIDNLDLVFERLNKAEHGVLRAFLMRAGAPVLIGTSVHPPSQDYGAAFYDQFKPHHLARLSLEEMHEVLVCLAERTGNTEIPARLEAEPGRLRALHSLTGGNPRTTVILFQIFAQGFSQEAYQDLESLLDWMTPHYKARLEELSDQAQVIVSALAAIWEPATSARLGERTRLQNSQISSNLDRLRKAGIVEEVTIDPETRSGPLPAGRSPQDRTGYQLAERFFNIWFLMRQATRREKRHLAFLTRFIECVHTPAERNQLARDLMRQTTLSRSQRAYGLALEPALSRRPESRAEAESCYRRALKLEPNDPLYWRNLALLLGSDLARYREAERAYRRSLELDPRHSPTWRDLGRLLQHRLHRPKQAEEAFRRALEIQPDSAETWRSLGGIYRDDLTRPEDAKAAFRRALELTPDDAGTWNTFGNLCYDHLGHSAEAEAAYRKAIEIAQGDSLCPRGNLVFLLRDQLLRREEAEQLYQELINTHAGKYADSLALQEALFAAHDSNWGIAASHLDRAFAAFNDTAAFPSDTIDDWMRGTAVFLHLGFGEALLAYLRTKGEDQRRRPWFEAIRAHLRGDRRYLRNIPAEMQEVARDLFDHIQRNLGWLPAGSRRWPVEPKKKHRRART